MTIARAARDLLLPVFLLPCVALAQQPPGAEPSPGPADGPRLEIERRIHFDEIIQGTVLELRVPLKNSGTAPLTIHQVEPSCGCTAVRLPAGPIPAGEKGELSLRYDSSGKLGSQSVQLHIYSDDPTQQDMGRFCTLVLVQGDVRSLYRVQPAGVFFGDVVSGIGGPGEPVERVVSITGQAEAREGFAARVAPGTPSHLQVELESLPPLRVGGKPRGANVKVRLLPGAPRGELSDVVVLETDLKEQPLIRIPVMGLVVGRVNVPDVVQFLSVSHGTRVERRVPIERRDGAGRLVVLRVESPTPWLELETETITPERSDLHVTLGELAPLGPFAFVLRVILSEPPGEVAEVPVYGLVLPRVRCEPALVLVRGSVLTGEQRLTLVGGRATSVRVEPANADLIARLDGEGPATSIVVGPAGGSELAASIIIMTDAGPEERLVVPIERLP